MNIAKNQSLFGTMGHIFAEKNPDGSHNGPMGGVYGPVNSAAMPCFLGLILARECGLANPEIAPGIERASRFYAYFAGRGSIPYGEHEPEWSTHDNNGKSGLAALGFTLQGNRAEEGRFFAKMSAASGSVRGTGHTGGFFNFVWSPMVQRRAAEQLATRSIDTATLNQITALANDPNGNSRVGACMTLGKISNSGTANARAATLAALLTDPQNHVRFMAAEAMRYLPDSAKLTQLNTILSAAASTGKPLMPFDEEDPLHFAHGRIAMLLFYSGNAYGPKGVIYGNKINTPTVINRTLLYPAIRAVAANPIGMCRSTLHQTYLNLTAADVNALAGSIVNSVRVRTPSDKMFSSGVREGGLQALEKYKIAEGVPLSMIYMVDDTRGDAYTNALGILKKYAAGSTTVTPDPDVTAFCQSLLGGAQAAAAQEVLDAIAANTSPAPLTPFKSIQGVTADAASLTLPVNQTSLHVNATDLAEGSPVFTWRKVHGAGNVTNSRLALALANAGFSTGNYQSYILNDGTQAGSGLGVTLGRFNGTNGKVVATQFQNSSFGTSGWNGNVFGNVPISTIGAGQQRLVIGTITQTLAGVFSVQATPVTPGSLQLRVNAGAVLKDPAGNALDTTTATTDDIAITVNPSMVNVPFVTGTTQAGAVAEITAAGLTVGVITQQNHPNIGAGSVISQNPAGSSSVAAGSSVDLVVSIGPDFAGDYAAWSAAYEPADLTDPAGDHDGDRMTNAEERLWGLDPTSAASLNPIKIRLDAASGTFTYTRRDPALTGCSCSVWVTGDFAGWDEDLTAQQSAGAPDEHGVQTVLVTLGSGVRGGRAPLLPRQGHRAPGQAVIPKKQMIRSPAITNMKIPLVLHCAFALLAIPFSTVDAAGKVPHKAWTDPETALREDPDFSVQGEYRFSDGKLAGGVQVIALGGGKFDAFLLEGGLPGAGWMPGNKRLALRGERKDGKIVFADESGAIRASIRNGRFFALETVPGDLEKFPPVLERIGRKSPTLGAKPPKGALVLFDGSSTAAWHNGKMENGHLLSTGATSKQKFGDYALHLEFRTPYMPNARGQQRGNSGVYHGGRWETQVLDSFGLEGRDNECGGIYSISKPRLNMCLPPLAWQTYDVEFTAAKFDENGWRTAWPRITVKLNGVVVHENLELAKDFTTAAPLNKPLDSPEGPVFIQDHNDPVVYRNIWIVTSSKPAKP